ncbi:TIR domain-containing protein [Demequina sp. NBRC 110055]|uniref:TIR domain-containing protein n=1 Tax=Demequina sp. NBRC 110055 TaxID=1570344 RepID=UPI001F3DA87C|nr:TIR domain-containing protein [Demequina sp. NBRC 110055]
MAVFLSFHYGRDAMRVQQILNMGAVEGQTILSAQDWESVKNEGDAAVENWIAEQMKYKRAVVVLVGQETASREWVDYEIRKAWNDGKKVLGVRIHGLADPANGRDRQGANPFAGIKLKNGSDLGDIVPVFNPSGPDSKGVYASIKENWDTWVDQGVSRSA